MITNYEKIANCYLKENETLWSMYFLPNNLYCITNSRFFIIENFNELHIISCEVILEKIKGISLMSNSKVYSYIGIHLGDQVIKLKMETRSINRFIQDILKHKFINTY